MTLTLTLTSTLTIQPFTGIGRTLGSELDPKETITAQAIGYLKGKIIKVWQKCNQLSRFTIICYLALSCGVILGGAILIKEFPVVIVITGGGLISGCSFLLVAEIVCRLFTGSGLAALDAQETQLIIAKYIRLCAETADYEATCAYYVAVQKYGERLMALVKNHREDAQKIQYIYDHYLDDGHSLG